MIPPDCVSDRDTICSRRGSGSVDAFLLVLSCPFPNCPDRRLRTPPCFRLVRGRTAKCAASSGMCVSYPEVPASAPNHPPQPQRAEIQSPLTRRGGRRRNTHCEARRATLDPDAGDARDEPSHWHDRASHHSMTAPARDSTPAYGLMRGRLPRSSSIRHAFTRLTLPESLSALCKYSCAHPLRQLHSKDLSVRQTGAGSGRWRPLHRESDSRNRVSSIGAPGFERGTSCSQSYPRSM